MLVGGDRWLGVGDLTGFIHPHIPENNRGDDKKTAPLICFLEALVLAELDYSSSTVHVSKER